MFGFVDVTSFYICIFHADCRLSEKGLRMIARWALNNKVKLEIINKILERNGFQVRLKAEKLGPERAIKVPKSTNSVKGDETDKLYGWRRDSNNTGVAFDIIGTIL